MCRWSKKTHKKKAEPLPWYRSRKYKGNLTEDKKRELDSFRFREKTHHEKHPAASWDDLPEEVTDYINKLQVELYDRTQDSLFNACLVMSGIGGFMILTHFGWISSRYDSMEVFLSGVLLFLAPWVYYPIKWKKTADRFWEDAREGIRHEWEFSYIMNKRHPEMED